MKIVDFDSDPSLLQQFLDFPLRHYASDSNWMPDPAEMRLLTETDSCLMPRRNFLALDGDHVCGRVTAIINPHVCDEDNHPLGQIGFFECVNDISVAALLVDSAIKWLSANLPAHGNILAPMNFDTWHSYRFRTKGFDRATFFMEPYNSSYYPTLFCELGFTPASYYVTKTIDDLAALLDFWKPYHLDTLAKGFTVRPFNASALPEEMSLIYRLSLGLFHENLFFTEISEGEFRALYAGMAGGLDPDLFLFLIDQSGDPVGLCFSIPDHRESKTVNVKTFGILPHIRQAGIGAGFAYEIYSRFQAKGFERVNHCLMRAGNRADGFDGGMGAVTREYALFSRSLRS